MGYVDIEYRAVRGIARIRDMRLRTKEEQRIAKENLIRLRAGELLDEFAPTIETHFSTNLTPEKTPAQYDQGTEFVRFENGLHVTRPNPKPKPKTTPKAFLEELYRIANPKRQKLPLTRKPRSR